MPYAAASDPYAFGGLGGAFARKVTAVSPSDSTDLTTYARALYIGVTGDVKVILADDLDSNPVTFKAHPVGYLPAVVRRVYQNGTTATNILALN